MDSSLILDDLVDLDRPGQIPRELVQRAGALFAMRRHPRLEAQARRQLPGDQADREHDART